MTKSKIIETAWGTIKTPFFVYIIGFSMIFFALFTIDFAKFAPPLMFLTFIFEYFREIDVIKFGLLSTLARFGFELPIFGGIWKIVGKMGLKNEERHYAMLIFCFIVSISIIKLANWDEGIIGVQKH